MKHTNQNPLRACLSNASRKGALNSGSKCLKTALALAALAGAPEVIHAQVIVHSFGPSDTYVSANQRLRLTDGTTITATTTTARFYSASMPITPATGTNYSGPEVFGGWQVSNITNTGSLTTSQFGFNHGNTRVNNATPDTLRFNVGAVGSANTVRFTASILTLGTFATADLSLSPAGITLNAAADSLAPAEGLDRTAYIRPVVQVGSSFFVGETPKTISNGNTTEISFSGSELSGYNWSTFDPTIQILYESNSSGSLSLANVTAAGVLVTRDYGATTTNADFRNAINISSLEVAAVPEPASTAIVAGLLALILLVRHRRWRFA